MALTDLPGVTYSRTGAATAWRNDGALQEFAPNVPRITDAGVTIEGQRTNFVTRFSRPLSSYAPALNFEDASPPTNSPMAGLNWVKRLPGQNYIYSAGSLDAGTYTVSVIVSTPDDNPPKANVNGSMGEFYLGVYHSAPTSSYLAATSYTVTSLGNRLWRVAGIVTIPEGTTITYNWILRSEPAHDKSRELLFTGAQTELGTRASTPIITTGAAATVGNDRLSLSNNVAADQDFTVVCDSVLMPSASSLGSILALSDGSPNNIHYLRRNSAGSISAASRVAAGPTLYSTSLQFADGGAIKMAMRRSGSVVTFVANGSIIGDVTSPSSPALSNMYLGNYGGVSQPIDVNFKSTQFFPFAMTDADLVRLTQ